ncbi:MULTISPECIES: chaperone NapD [Paracoccus]|jgi:nitrate reductase NapD|uniref:Chaperone NapD n=1 Tax=Paracoccus denitrificans (strain Pd 1222) TaxID=318586 RepID=A1BB87_PARDP|nr:MULTISPECIES: chaperone NapD [Paracoccus]ABL72781.1 periplasmic nitrate reductase chaperone NapD [Paracoccus denitrificans PD1222]MBB4626259.1 nitrate reductase NapD [Paracoccus denitrificans]MCU7427535.1 chaperone NapD [Paracoccus denitrificans]MDK8871109.1 chaperone NapD [Paracoccus sp. SSJ]QAR29741.1 nitrate reductase formation protein NapD [Paracoccus denitrificans]
MREPDRTPIQRRDILTGKLKQDSGAESRFLHISSAIVTARPDRAAELARHFATLPGTEVHAVQGAKIVLVLEGASVGEIGGRMAEISVMEGVFSANLVFEQILPADEKEALA